MVRLMNFVIYILLIMYFLIYKRKSSYWNHCKCYGHAYGLLQVPWNNKRSSFFECFWISPEHMSQLNPNPEQYKKGILENVVKFFSFTSQDTGGRWLFMVSRQQKIQCRWLPIHHLYLISKWIKVKHCIPTNTINNPA